MGLVNGKPFSEFSMCNCNADPDDIEYVDESDPRNLIIYNINNTKIHNNNIINYIF